MDSYVRETEEVGRKSERERGLMRRGSEGDDEFNTKAKVDDRDEL